MKAWHFVGTNLRNGEPVPKDGEKLIQTGEIIPCKNGLHGSVRIMDALQYASRGTKFICRVEHGGTIVSNTDKVASSERTIIWRVDADPILRKFARMCASDVLHLWNAPEIVKQYLKTGDESIREAARAAARATAADAAADAAWDAARAAAADAARATARDAAWAAAWDAARDAARDAQNDRLTRMVMSAHREAK